MGLMAGGGDQTLNPRWETLGLGLMWALWAAHRTLSVSESHRMTNVSHTIKHLSFSDANDGKFHRKARRSALDKA